jgi:hypothetical protein
MIKEIKEGLDNGLYSIKKVAQGKACYQIDVLGSNGKPSTSVLLDESGKTVQMTWTVGQPGKRGSGYSRTKVSSGYEKGHIKSVNEGALDNAIEDSPINIIEQTRHVNDSKMKAFETFRVKECQGKQVTTDILDEPKGYVRVRVPDEKIDVIYNPRSTDSKDWPKEWYKEKGPFN